MRPWDGGQHLDTRLTSVKIKDLPPEMVALQHDLIFAVRLGDVERTRYLVNVKGAIVNFHDESDASPLYYASLCGHENVVTFLIEKGANCEEDTFDGERCLYAALNQNIRRILKKEGFAFSSVIRDPFLDFFNRVFDVGVISTDSENTTRTKTLPNELKHTSDQEAMASSAYSDISFVVHKKDELKLHRWVLCFRCPYLRERMMTSWREKSVVSLGKLALDPDALVAFMRYLYTGKLQLHIVSAHPFMRICRQCKMYNLISIVEEKLLSSSSNSSWIVSYPATAKKEISTDLQPLVRHALSAEQPPMEYFFDLKIIVGDETFHCHKLLWCGKSPYLDCLYKRNTPAASEGNEKEHDSPSESKTETETETEFKCDIVQIQGFSAQVIRNVIEFLYMDTIDTENINPDDFLDIIQAAEMMLLKNLKSFCAAFIADYIDQDNVFSFIHTARLFSIPRLEDSCVMHIALNLDIFAERPELYQLVRESAESIANRQEYDSVPIADDMKNFVNQRYRHLDNIVLDCDDGDEPGVYHMERARRDLLLGKLREILQTLGIRVRDIQTNGGSGLLDQTVQS